MKPRISELSAEEITRRAGQLTDEHWRLLERLAADKALGFKPGGRNARLAWEMQQQAFAWPGRSPFWKITKHGRAALAMRAVTA